MTNVKSVKKSVNGRYVTFYVNLDNGKSITRTPNAGGEWRWNGDLTTEMRDQMAAIMRDAGIVVDSPDFLPLSKLPVNEAIWLGKFTRSQAHGDGEMVTIGGRARWMD